MVTDHDRHIWHCLDLQSHGPQPKHRMSEQQWLSRKGGCQGTVLYREHPSRSQFDHCDPIIPILLMTHDLEISACDHDRGPNTYVQVPDSAFPVWSSDGKAPRVAELDTAIDAKDAERVARCASEASIINASPEGDGI